MYVRGERELADAGAALEVVDEAGGGVEADHVDGVGDEVGEGVDVVEVGEAVAGGDEVLDAADVEAALADEADSGVDDVAGGVEGFDLERLLGRGEGGGAEVAGFSFLGRRRDLADVGGAEVEAFGGVGEDLDRVEGLAVQDLNADDGALFR